MLILQAIEQVYSEEGVAVLVDLGSAVLSAEMAIEQLPPERRARVVLSDAPLVEGALAAAVQAQLGSPLARVLAEARGALAAKAMAVQTEPTASVAAPGVPPARRDMGELQLELIVHNRLGLHLRPAARFVQTASRFGSTHIEVRNLATGRGPADAKSISAVATLGVRHDHPIRITANGPDARAALSRAERSGRGELWRSPQPISGTQPHGITAAPEHQYRKP